MTTKTLLERIDELAAIDLQTNEHIGPITYAQKVRTLLSDLRPLVEEAQALTQTERRATGTIAHSGRRLKGLKDHAETLEGFIAAERTWHGEHDEELSAFTRQLIPIAAYLRARDEEQETIAAVVQLAAEEMYAEAQAFDRPALAVGETPRTVPLTRYNAVLKELDEAEAKLKRVQHDAGEEIRRLERELTDCKSALGSSRLATRERDARCSELQAALENKTPKPKVIAAFVSPESWGAGGECINVTEDGRWYSWTGLEWQEMCVLALAAQARKE